LLPQEGAPVAKRAPAPPPPEPEDEEDGKSRDPLAGKSSDEIAAYVERNPWAHLHQQSLRTLFVIGQKEMRRIMEFGPPNLNGKINPELFRRWLWAKRDTLRRDPIKKQ
jgi:hypothetical protein